jgi:hypothetical protein
VNQNKKPKVIAKKRGDPNRRVTENAPQDPLTLQFF